MDEASNTGDKEENMPTAHSTFSSRSIEELHPNPLFGVLPEQLQPNDISIEQREKMRMFRRNKVANPTNNNFQENSNNIKNNTFKHILHDNEPEEMISKRSKLTKHYVKHKKLRHSVNDTYTDKEDIKNIFRRDIENESEKDNDIFNEFLNNEKSYLEYTRIANLLYKENKEEQKFGQMLDQMRRKRNTEVRRKRRSATGRKIRSESDMLPSRVSKNDLNFYGFACICPLRYKGQKCEGKQI